METKIEKWGLFEITLKGSQEGNPFQDVMLEAIFSNGETDWTVSGFYDGEGMYKVRFMPISEGKWSYFIRSSDPQMDRKSGSFLCVQNTGNNHGIVHVKNQFHFSYADGTPFFPFGTTCYAWIHQPKDLQEETLESLKNSPYNKVRMCIFPKFYHNNQTEPEQYPYEGLKPDQWDFTRFNPAFFQKLECLILRMQKIGVEAELILFHPYDGGHWGFDRMNRQEDDLYLRYIISRLGAFRNIWWSVANEYDYMKEKKKADWDRNIDIIGDTDIYHHLLSIHQGDILYDHWNTKLTHTSIQMGTKEQNGISVGFGVYKVHRDTYHKPVIYDEVGYEGNLTRRWGSCSAEELVEKYWMAAVSGAYMTHGETFTHPDDIIWWSKGGKLKGQSTARIAFLKKIIEESDLDGLEPLDRWWVLNGAGKNGAYYLFYFGRNQLRQWKFEIPAFKLEKDIPYGTKFKVDIIDTWNMTVTPCDGFFEATDKGTYSYTCNFRPYVELPGREYMAIRIVPLDK